MFLKHNITENKKDALTVVKIGIVVPSNVSMKQVTNIPESDLLI